MQHVQLTLYNDPKYSRFILQISPPVPMYIKLKANFILLDTVKFVLKLMQMN